MSTQTYSSAQECTYVSSEYYSQNTRAHTLTRAYACLHTRRKWFEDKLIDEQEYREEKAKILAQLRQ